MSRTISMVTVALVSAVIGGLATGPLVAGSCLWTPAVANPAPAYPQLVTNQGSSYAVASADAGGKATAKASNEKKPNTNSDASSAYSGNSQRNTETASPAGCREFTKARYGCDLAVTAWGRAWSSASDRAVATSDAMLSDDAGNTVGPSQATVDVSGGPGAPHTLFAGGFPGNTYTTPWAMTPCVSVAVFQAWAEAEADVQGAGQSNAEAGAFYFWSTLTYQFVALGDC